MVAWRCRARTVPSLRAAWMAKSGCGTAARAVSAHSGQSGRLRRRAPVQPGWQAVVVDVATTGCSYTQRVWEVATGKQLLAYDKHDNIVFAAALSPDGRLAATGGGSKQEIHIWDTQPARRRSAGR